MKEAGMAPSLSPHKTVYSIGAGIPFAQAIAAHLLQQTKEDPQALAAIRIFLPTRRACHVLRQAFLHLSSAPLLLPRLQPLGDIDGEELALSVASDHLRREILAMPPSISPLRRQILLAKLIAADPGYRQGFDQALRLGSELGRLLDQVIIEEVSLDNLERLVPQAIAQHWQKTIDFLAILRTHWPAILAEEGCIDAADRRNRLIRALATSWQRDPPQEPIIAAGSTGSIPATAALLDVIAGLPQGAVILPGLDAEIDAESWESLPETHPQHGLQQLLRRMNVSRAQVRPWPLSPTASLHNDGQFTDARRILAREMMRPGSDIAGWQDLATSTQQRSIISKAQEGLDIINCENDREEADVIAGFMREVLAGDTDQTAALVTPDRVLARRVAMACRRWGIEVDDSAGQSLADTPVGIFVRLIVQASQKDFEPVSLLALLKHPLAGFGIERKTYRDWCAAFEISLLRGPAPPPGLEGITGAIRLLPEPLRAEIEPTWRVIAPILAQAIPGSGASQKDIKLYNFNDLIKNHLQAAEAIAALPAGLGPEANMPLWAGDAGQTASAFWAELQLQAGTFPPVALNDYEKIITLLMQDIVLRPTWGRHARLAILGQLEARLAGADVLILGGLNEGVWPALPGHDPWMSRPMRADFGLPPRARDVGLAAHDFVQAFCRPRVIITRSAKSGGAPTVPSRWLQRLDTVLAAAHIPAKTGGPMLQWMRDAMIEPGPPRPVQRPAPRPPVTARPRRLAATRIETWQKDPYGIYARYVLNLRRLEPIAKAPDAALRGNMLHTILQEFVRRHPRTLPPTALQDLLEIAHNTLASQTAHAASWSFWWPRFARIAAWVVLHEEEWRRMATPVLTERKGSLDLAGPAGVFTLEATPDRIDQTPEGLAVIDYKSGGSFKKGGIRNGEHPQLALEALIARAGGFPDIPPGPVGILAYWLLKGGDPEGEIILQDKDLDAVLEETESGLMALIRAFDDPATPYYSLPWPERRPRFNDYEHLARIREWTALSEIDSEAA